MEVIENYPVVGYIHNETLLVGLRKLRQNKETDYIKVENVSYVGLLLLTVGLRHVVLDEVYLDEKDVYVVSGRLRQVLFDTKVLIWGVGMAQMVLRI